MALLVGLDIGSRAVKGAVFSGRGSNLRLVDFFVEDIPSIEAQAGNGQGPASAGEADMGTPEGLEEFVTGLLKSRNLRDADVAGVVDTKDCTVREFTVPFVRDEQIAKTIYFEAENHFPGVDLENVQLEYVKIDELGGKSRLVCWALDNERLEERLGLYKRVGVDPVALDVDAGALFNAWTATPAFDPGRSTVLLDLGKTSTKILVVENGHVRKVRSLRLEAAAVSPERQLAEPVAVGAEGAGAGGGAGAPTSNVPATTGGDGSSPATDDLSIEARFREIEEALRRLDPVEDEAQRSEEANDDLADTPIAILSDEDYDLVREEATEHGEAAGPAGANEEPPVDDGTTTVEVPLGSEEPSEGPEPGGRSGPEATGGSHEGDGGEAPGIDRLFAGAEETFDRRRHLERIALEIQRSLVGVRLASPVDRICITGGLADEESRSYLADTFDVETIPLDFDGSLSTDLEEERVEEAGRVGAVAVGLGLKAAGQDRMGIDFRKGPYRYEHKLEKLRFMIAVAASLFFAFALQAVFWSIQDWKEERSRLEYFREYSAQSFEKFFGDPVPAGAEPLSIAKQREKAWTGRGVGRSARYIDFVEAVSDIGELLDETGSYFDMTTMTLNLKAKIPTSRSGGSSASERTLVPKPPPSSLVVLETNDRRMATKIRTEFHGPKSDVFNVVISQPTSRGELDKLNLELTVKKSKLEEIK